MSMSMSPDNPMCEAVITEYQNGWPFERRCANPGKHEVKALYYVWGEGPQPRTVHLCGVHKRKLERPHGRVHRYIDRRPNSYRNDFNTEVVELDRRQEGGDHTP